MTIAPHDPLPSWRDGAVKHALARLPRRCADVPVADRVAMFDNDGTLWCEKPQYLQLLFMLDQLRQAVAVDPSLAAQPEFRALIEHDQAPRPNSAWSGSRWRSLQLTIGLGPRGVRRPCSWVRRGDGHRIAVPLRRLRYQPMIELIDALRAESFSVFIVTGGGTEFVRAISQDFYGVPPEGVVGTLVNYDFTRDAQGRPAARSLRRDGRRCQRRGGEGGEHPARTRSATDLRGG